MAEPKISIIPNGPYRVTGGVPLDEKIIRSEGAGYRWEEGRELRQSDEYYLCRCGHSNDAPFCDGSHRKVDFSGEETAANNTYEERAEIFYGDQADILDDNRCAFARFCHGEKSDGTPTDAWALGKTAQSDEDLELLKRVTGDCPAGRLTMRTHDGTLHEPELEPRISVMQDPDKGVSDGLYVQGGVTLCGADGEEYERRNRYALCRCGSSRNKPFCDAFHVPARYNDGHVSE